MAGYVLDATGRRWIVACGHRHLRSRDRAPNAESIVHDFPGSGWRVKEPAQGIMATILNGEVLLENGEHTGALPGKVLRNTYYHAHSA